MHSWSHFNIQNFMVPIQRPTGSKISHILMYFRLHTAANGPEGDCKPWRTSTKFALYIYCGFPSCVCESLSIWVGLWLCLRHISFSLPCWLSNSHIHVWWPWTRPCSFTKPLPKHVHKPNLEPTNQPTHICPFNIISHFCPTKSHSLQALPPPRHLKIYYCCNWWVFLIGGYGGWEKPCMLCAKLSWVKLPPPPTPHVEGSTPARHVEGSKCSPLTHF